MEGFWLFAIIVFFAVVGGLTSKVAGEKGYSGLAWFFIGGLLAPIGLFAAIGLPDKRLRELLKETRRSSTEDEQPSSQPERVDSPSTGSMKPFIAIAGTILAAILMFVLLIPRILD